MEEPVQSGSDHWPERSRHPPRLRVRLAHLPLDLCLAEHHRLEPRRHPKQVLHRGAILMHVKIAFRTRHRILRLHREEMFGGVDPRPLLDGKIEFGAIASRKQNGFPCRSRIGQRGERSPELRAPERETLPHLDGGRPVIDSYGGESHQGITETRRPASSAPEAAGR